MATPRPLSATPQETARDAARAMVEQAARAISEGDLGLLNRLMHPAAVAELAQLADEEDGDSEHLQHVQVTDAGGTDRRPGFLMHFVSESLESRIRVTAEKGAAAWRIRRLEPVEDSRREPQNRPPPPGGQRESSRAPG